MILLLPFFIFLSNPLNAINNFHKQLDCQKFRTGTFYNVKDGDIDTKIVRTDSLQIEEYYSLNAMCSFKVKWTDECTYELIFNSGDENCMKIIDPKNIVVVKILETDDKSYSIEGWIKGSDFRYHSILVLEQK